MPSFTPNLRRQRSGDQAYTSVTDDVESEEARPLQEPEKFEYETPDGDIYALRKQLQRANLYLRILLGMVAFVAISMLISPVTQVVKEYRSPGSSSNEPLIKTPVPPRKSKQEQSEHNAC